MSPVIKTIEHTVSKDILICTLASRLYVGLMFLPVAHISEGVALSKVDHSQLFSSPSKPCVERPSVLHFPTVAPQFLIMHIRSMFINKTAVSGSCSLLFSVTYPHDDDHVMPPSSKPVL